MEFLEVMSTTGVLGNKIGETLTQQDKKLFLNTCSFSKKDFVEVKSETKFGQIDFEKIVMETTIAIKRSLTGGDQGKKEKKDHSLQLIQLFQSGCWTPRSSSSKYFKNNVLQRKTELANKKIVTVHKCDVSNFGCF